MNILKITITSFLLSITICFAQDSNSTQVETEKKDTPATATIVIEEAPAPIASPAPMAEPMPEVQQIPEPQLAPIPPIQGLPQENNPYFAPPAPMPPSSNNSLEEIFSPEHNMGIDYLSDEIEDGQAELDKETGIRFFFDYIGTLLSNPSGGYRHSSTYNQEIVYGFEFDLERIFGWKGASFVISGAYDSGADLKNSTGSFFSPSQIALVDGVIFYELYLKQDFDLSVGSLGIKMGRFSVGDDFCTLPAYGVLVSGAMDANPAAIFANSPFTGSPTATWTISATYDTEFENISFAAVLSQAPKDLQSSTWDGLNFDISSDDGYLAMLEARWKPSFCEKYDAQGNPIKNSGLDGSYNVGVYYFGGYDPNLISGYDRESGYGIYIQGQQMLIRWDEHSYLAMWAGMQASPVETSCAVSYMAFSGLQLQGFIPERPHDGIYFSYYAAFFSDKYLTSSGEKASSEMGIEITYVFQLNKHIALQPDIQYIIRPNGDSTIDDALVIGAQVAISF